jgi:cation diffusion facilitator family transporter
MTARLQVRRVLAITLILNLSVAAGKIIVGAVTGALAISADGVHSLIDGASNVMALLANRAASKPPDDQHPYGHRRFETVAAFGIGVLLLLAGWEIITEALGRLGGEHAPDLTPLAFAIMIGTLIINIGVTTYERRMGEKLKSELLLADAAHTRSDVYVTLSVLISMGLVAAGLGWADSLAALVVVGFIVKAAYEVLRSAGDVLVDRAPLDSRWIAAEAAQIPGVESVTRARSRGTHDAAHVDVDIAVPAAMTADRAGAIADGIKARLRDLHPGIAEVEVHVAPSVSETPDPALIVRARADSLGLSAHELRSADDGRRLELHVEVPAGESLAQAHARATALEREIAAALPEVEDVVTHIEPALSDTPARDETEPTDESATVAEALALLRAFDPGARWHDPRLSPLEDGYALAIHAALPADLTVEQAHDRAEAAEMLLRAKMPHIRRVTIHTEPED